MGIRDILGLLGDIPRGLNLGWSTLAGNRDPLTPEEEELLYRLGAKERPPLGGPAPYTPPSSEDELFALMDRPSGGGFTRGTEQIRPWNKPERDYSGGYSERLSGGGTFNVGKMTPEWAPIPEEDRAGSIGSILTTSALQQLVTNRPVNPQYGEAVARLKNAAVQGREAEDLSKGRRVGGDVAEYLFELERQGKIPRSKSADLAVELLGNSRNQFGMVDPDAMALAREVVTNSSGTRTPGTERLEIVQEGTPVTLPTEHVANTPGGEYEETRKGPDGRLYGRRGTEWFDTLTGEKINAVFRGR